MFSGAGDTIAMIALWALPVLIAVTLHEAAHGYLANRLGDDSAKRAGRLTLNPFAHIDPFGTVFLPLVLLLFTNFAFGYAKPVPVDASRLRRPKRDMIWIALAGPGMNLAIALLAAILLPITLALEGGFGAWAERMLHIMIFFNCLIAIFNMLPVPPLDGGRVAVGLLPDGLAHRYARVEAYGLFLVVGILFLLPMLTQTLGIAFNPAYPLVLLPSQGLYEGILAVLGLGG